MRIKKEDIKRIINILETQYNELEDGEYFEFNGKRLIKTQLDKFCIKQNLSSEVCKWFAKIDGTRSAHISGGFRYLYYNKGETGFESELIYPEITIEQFREFIKDK
jgi:hypothetical protein